MAQRGLLDARGKVGDERHPENLHSGLACGDCLEGGRHSHDVPSDGLGHLHFGRSLIVRAAELRVYPLIEGWLDLASEVTQAQRVQVGQVNKRRPFERGVRGEVDVVADQNGGSRRPGLANAAGTVGENHDGCSGRSRRAHTVHNATNAVALVVVGAGPDDEGALAGGQQHRPQGSHVALEGRLAEAGDLRRRDCRRGLTNEVGGFRPSAAKGQGDVVTLNTRLLGDVCGGLGGNRERVCGGVIKRMCKVLGRHPSTLFGRALVFGINTGEGRGPCGVDVESRSGRG